MNGPSHYKAAEICLAHASELMARADEADVSADADTIRLMLNTAKAHTDLAQVAVTAFGITAGPMAPETDTAKAWRDAIA